ncbi:MAG: TonB-dependent receptor plug domain-containing protein [Bacteroidales bacterium]
MQKKKPSLHNFSHPKTLSTMATYLYKKKLTILLTGLLLLAGINYSQAQESLREPHRNLLEQLEKMETEYPRQTAFLHTDKQEYLAGEIIWLKAYLVNATTLEPDTLSTNFYVELINTESGIAEVMLLRLEEGFAHGDILLPDSLSEGNYQLRAYTDWMRNFDDDFFFTKDIYVYNPIEENFIKTWDVLKNRWFNWRLGRQRDNMQFAFFPEGGQMIAGKENRVAFKSANALGAGVEASGVLVDDNGNEVLEFSTFHNGMGSFTFTPEEGRNYHANIKYANGDTERERLPDTESMGYMLSADIAGGEIQVQVHTNLDTGTVPRADEVFLVAQTRGRAYYTENTRLVDGSVNLSIPTDKFPTGTCQLTLFDAAGQPIAERLVFVNHGNIAEADLEGLSATTVEDPEGDSREGLSLDVQLPDDVSGGSYSLAVIDTPEDAPDHSANIASELLIFAGLSYKTEDPWYYLSEPEGDPARALDLVMMTHGWKRFDWEAIAEGEFPEIRHDFPSGVSISGQMEARSSGRDTGITDIELAVIAEDDSVRVFKTTTDREGNFEFPTIEQDGIFTAEFRPDDRYERRIMDINLNVRKFEDLEFKRNFDTRPKQVTSRGDDWEKVDKPETILSKRQIAQENNEPLSMFGVPNQVIYFEDVRDQYSHMLDVLRTRVRGLRIVSGEITLRGPSSLFFSNEPLFMVDEMAVSRGTFLNTSVEDVDRLAVITGADAAILGSRGANGALIIYTRRSDQMRRPSYEYLMAGFHEPTETFDSMMDTRLYRETGMNRTLFWEARLETGETGNKTFSFPVDEHVRNMRVIVQGIDKNGRITFSQFFLGNDQLP